MPETMFVTTPLSPTASAPADVPAVRTPLRQRVAQRMVRTLCRGILAALRVRTEVRGAWPREPVLMIANHLSWLDVVVVLARKPCTFVAKSDVRRWPLVGWFGDAVGVVWVDRSRKRDLLRAIPALQETLQTGTSVLLFAEGTTGDGHDLLPFKSGLVEGAVRAGVPTVPMAVKAAASDGDLTALAWVGDETLVANLPRVAGLRDACITLHVAPALAPAPRKRLTRDAYSAIAARTIGGAIRRSSPRTRHPASHPRTFTPPPATIL